MLQSFVSKLQYKNKKTTEDTLVPPWEKRGGGKSCFFYLICSRDGTRRNLCFHVGTCQHAASKTAHAPIDPRSRDRITPRPIRFQCRARPMNVDDGLEDIRWIRGQGGERLPAASCALLPNVKKEKKVFFAIGEGSIIVLVCFLHQSPKVLYQAPAMYHQPWRELCDQRVGRSPQLARPVQNS